VCVCVYVHVVCVCVHTQTHHKTHMLNYMPEQMMLDK
jgi:hypothetical protein